LFEHFLFFKQLPHHQTQYEPQQTAAAPQAARIVRGLNPERVKEDDTIVLKALYSGYPTPKVSWYKNNAPLIMSQRHLTHVEDSKKLCALKIRNAKKDDSGVYSVVVENPYGSDDSSTQVVVVTPQEQRSIIPSTSVPTPIAQIPSTPTTAIKKPSQSNEQQHKPLKYQAPHVVEHVNPEQTVTEGKPVVLSCIIEGTPIPQITYLKNEQPLAASSRIQTSYDANSGLCMIKFDDANVYDAGAFKIRAENPYGKAETAGIVYVNPTSVIDARPVVDPNAFKYLPTESVPKRPAESAVPQSPRLPTHHGQPQPQQPSQRSDEEPMLAPNFVIGLPANYKIHEGEPIKLACQVEGNPKPSVTWLKDGQNLPASLRFNTDYVVPTGVCHLNVSGTLLTDCGNYTAVATNAVGKAYTTCQIFVKESGGVDSNPITNPDAFKYLNKPKLHGKYESPAEDSQTDDDVPLNRAKPPKVIHGLPNLRQLEGEPVMMACKIDGFPKPTVSLNEKKH
jgi:hypothetical protein